VNPLLPQDLDMSIPSVPTPSQAILHTLVNADGSATYVAPNNTYTIVAGVNYPVEVPYRSDEIPESTLIEVNLRPHNGIGMVRERHVEQLVRRTLQTVVLTEESPRTMLQLTLQVVGVESDESLPGGVKEGGQGESYLDLLASSVNAAVLGCLDAGVQMSQLTGAVLIGVGPDGALVPSPGVRQRKKCTSLHVFGFIGNGDLVLVESEGRFKLEQWKAAGEIARALVLGKTGTTTGADVAMDGLVPDEQSQSSSVMDVMRKAVEARVAQDERWRGG